MKRILLAVLLLGSMMASYGTVYHYVRNVETGKIIQETGFIQVDNDRVTVIMPDRTVRMDIVQIDQVKDGYKVVLRDKSRRYYEMYFYQNGRIFWKIGKVMVELIE